MASDRLGNHNQIQGRRRLNGFSRDVASDTRTVEEARASLLSWNAHLAYGDRVRQRRRLYGDVDLCCLA